MYEMRENENRPPTLSLPGIRLHLTFRALKVGVGGDESSEKQSGDPRTCRHHKRYSAFVGEVRSLPVRAFGSGLTGKAWRELEERGMGSVNRRRWREKEDKLLEP